MTYIVLMVRPEYGYAANFRFMGILQRIALCYGCAALITLYSRPKGLYAWLVGLLLGYWLLLIVVPVPGYGAGQLGSAETNLASYLDRLILGRGLWYGENFDPEGLLSTLPAIATTLFGVTIGQLLFNDQPARSKLIKLIGGGTGLVLLGWVWSFFFPLNRILWTSSFVVLTAGQAMILLGLAYWLIDIKGWHRGVRPLAIFGINAITVYFLGEIVYHVLLVIKVTPGGSSGLSLYNYIYEHVFHPLLPARLASLVFACCWVGLWCGLVHQMHRRHIIIKV